jgi:hypothetical protein
MKFLNIFASYYVVACYDMNLEIQEVKNIHRRKKGKFQISGKF